MALSMFESTNASSEQVELNMSEQAKSWVLEIDQRMQNRYFTLREAFRAFDTDKTGDITESKFIEGIFSLNA